MHERHLEILADSFTRLLDTVTDAIRKDAGLPPHEMPSPVALRPWFEAILHRLAQLENTLMSALSNLRDQVARETTVTQSAVTLLQQLKSLLDAAIASGDPTQIQALSDQLGQQADALAAAVTQNTPGTGGTGGSPSALTISGLSPTSGPVGSSVTISGSGFVAGSTVAFGGSSPATPDSINDTVIAVTVPVDAASGVVVVSGSTGSATSTDSFSVG
jgi:hypothetical protein